MTLSLSLALSPSPVLRCQQHLLPLHVTLPPLMRRLGGPLRVRGHLLHGGVPVCRGLRHERGGLRAVHTVWLQRPQQILHRERPSRVTAVCVCVSVCEDLFNTPPPPSSPSVSCSSRRSLWLRTVPRLVSAPAPGPCAGPRPARADLSAPSTTSNGSVTEVCVSGLQPLDIIWAYTPWTQPPSEPLWTNK